MTSDGGGSAQDVAGAARPPAAGAGRRLTVVLSGDDVIDLRADEHPAGRARPEPAAGADPPPAGVVLSVALRRPTRLGVAQAALGVLGAALAVVGGFGLYLLAVSDVHERRAQHHLAADLRSRVEVAGALAANPTVAGERTTLAAPARGEPLGLLRIPALGVARVVVEGSEPGELSKGPGHVAGTPMPGHQGNTVVLGHRTAFGGAFGGLDRLEPGDRVSMATADGSFDYRVERVEDLRPGETDVFAQNFRNRLTLATADSGTAPKGRLVAVARLEGDAEPATEAPEPLRLSRAESGVGPDTDAWPGALLWGAALAGALAAARSVYRRWGWRAAHLVTVPPVLALALLFYEQLARLLPSTL